MSTFAESHKDFVLKLKFLGEGDEVAQIRRVRLPRIIKDNTICYEELVGIAISFVIPQNPSKDSDFEVKLTYHDVDNDTVVIGSSEELLDAIDQFSEQRVLRISAEIKRFVTAATPPALSSLGAEAPRSRASFTAAPSDAGVPTGSGSSSRSTPVVQSVVESVVNVILNAAVAMNSRGDLPSSTPVFYSPDGIPAPSPAENPREERAETENVEIQTTEDIPVENTVPSEPAASEEEVNPSPAVTEPNAVLEETAANEERPFIHGRHTCDSCLTTPIVGKRYHAVNLSYDILRGSDYDLCEKCHGNYKGGEITFESAELDRDRHLQARWNRRRDRMTNSKGRCGGHARRLGAGVGHHNRWGPAAGPRGLRFQPHHPGFPKHPSPHGHAVHRPPANAGLPPPPGPPLPWYSMETTEKSEEAPEDLDEAMRLAIQLSIQDAQEKKVPPPANVSPSKADDASSQNTMQIFVKTLNGKTVTVDVNPSDTIGDVKIKACAKAAEDEVETATVKSSVSKQLMAAKAAPVLKEEIAETPLVETVKDGDEDEMKMPAIAPKPSAPAEEEVMSLMADESAVSHGFHLRLPSDSSTVSKIKSEGSHSFASAAKEDGSIEETSFSSDAVGNGDVADLLGSTLDKCAEFIDAMVTELNTEYSYNHSTSSSFVGLQNPGDDMDDGSEDGVEAEGPQTILESVVTPRVHSESTRSDEDWHVVSDDLQIGGDEELARAAQMIGSALFNSDIRSSQEQMSTLSGSADGISFASSVPTLVPSISNTVVAAQRERWAMQLEHLHAMGFDDDARCVEILERLTAANIGCGSNDEVSVSEVLNELWKN